MDDVLFDLTAYISLTQFIMLGHGILNPIHHGLEVFRSLRETWVDVKSVRKPRVHFNCHKDVQTLSQNARDVFAARFEDRRSALTRIAKC